MICVCGLRIRKWGFEVENVVSESGSFGDFFCECLNWLSLVLVYVGSERGMTWSKPYNFLRGHTTCQQQNV